MSQQPADVADLDLLPDGVVIADADGQVVVCNEAATALLGIDEPIVDEDGGQSLADVMAVTNYDGAKWFDAVNPYGGMRSRRILLENIWYAADGRELLVVVRLYRAHPGGSVTRVAISIRDSKSRTQTERDRSDLVATVAHELRSPLTGVKGFTSTLLSKWEFLNDSQRRLMLQTVDADADRLTRLIEDLLDVARIDTGRLTVRPREFDLVEALRRQVEPLRAQADRTDGLVLTGDDQVQVWGDPDRLAQVAANLIENATRHGRGKTIVTVTSHPRSGAELLVDDAGQGIPEYLRPRIFHKFWRQGTGSGSGLGLYIVHGIVAAHGGEVTIETSPMGGARMRVTLPPPPVDA
jgi:signal transduction histidine kinase